MKGFNLFTISLVVVGIILIAAGWKNQSPAQIFRDALKLKSTPANPTGTGMGGGSSFDPKNPTAGSGGGGGGGGGSSW